MSTILGFMFALIVSLPVVDKFNGLEFLACWVLGSLAALALTIEPEDHDDQR